MLVSKRLYHLLWVLFCLAILVALFPALTTLWWGLSGLALIAAIIDALQVFYMHHNITAERKLPGSFPLGVWKQIELVVHNSGHKKRTLGIFDHHPQEVHIRNLPQTTTIERGKNVSIFYQAKAIKRGKINFPLIQIQLQSPLGLWQYSITTGSSEQINVYPNFAAVSKFLFLAMDNRLSQMGILKKQRRGEGLDFHQLREYRKGDPLRQIDWKATSRTHKLISKEYQDERDQQIIFLVDCGHRMLAKDAELSHFDHTLNATLLLAYVALKQGDAIGFATFSGQDRWLPPFKGLPFIKRLLNQLFDLQPTNQSPDYSTAVTQLLKKQKKRSLVIIISNVRDEDTEDLVPALNLLRKKHVVLLASMREEAIQSSLDDSIKGLDDAIRVAAIHDYLEHRKTAFNKIRASGINCVDVLPSQLSVQLVNSYLEIKASGKL